MENVILMGIKHCGKSAQGKLLAQRFLCDFFDTDDLIFEMTKKTPREIYSTCGKESFLNAEIEACRVAAQKSGRFVLATGGGFCTNEKAVDILRGKGKFVFLCADEKTACDRIISEIEVGEGGALLNLPAYIARENPANIEDVRAIFHGFFEERTAIYRKIADIEVQMLPVPKIENLERIVAALA